MTWLVQTRNLRDLRKAQKAAYRQRQPIEVRLHERKHVRLEEQRRKIAAQRKLRLPTAALEDELAVIKDQYSTAFFLTEQFGVMERSALYRDCLKFRWT